MARVDGAFAGFVSITPPGEEYSIDRYLSRGALPFLFDEGLWEIRILTVAQEFRGSPVAFLLMYAAFREIESEGGTRIVAIGRKEVIGLYERVGMQNVGPEFRSGAVTFQPMIVTIEELRGSARLLDDTIAALRPRAAWNLPIPFRSPDGCEHGGAFLQRREGDDRPKTPVSTCPLRGQGALGHDVVADPSRTLDCAPTPHARSHFFVPLCVLRVFVVKLFPIFD